MAGPRLCRAPFLHHPHAPATTKSFLFQIPNKPVENHRPAYNPPVSRREQAPLAIAFPRRSKALLVGKLGYTLLPPIFWNHEVSARKGTTSVGPQATEETHAIPSPRSKCQASRYAAYLCRLLSGVKCNEQFVRPINAKGMMYQVSIGIR
jgi:hypothetical protein